METFNVIIVNLILEMTYRSSCMEYISFYVLITIMFYLTVEFVYY